MKCVALCRRGDNDDIEQRLVLAAVVTVEDCEDVI